MLFPNAKEVIHLKICSIATVNKRKASRFQFADGEKEARSRR